MTGVSAGAPGKYLPSSSARRLLRSSSLMGLNLVVSTALGTRKTSPRRYPESSASLSASLLTATRALNLRLMILAMRERHPSNSRPELCLVASRGAPVKWDAIHASTSPWKRWAWRMSGSKPETMRLTATILPRKGTPASDSIGTR